MTVNGFKKPGTPDENCASILQMLLAQKRVSSHQGSSRMLHCGWCWRHLDHPGGSGQESSGEMEGNSSCRDAEFIQAVFS